jgi:hypothetical protein
LLPNLFQVGKHCPHCARNGKDAATEPVTRQVRLREGRYLVRTNLTSTNPAELWRYTIQRTQVEEAFKNLKGDLSLRPIFHQLESHIEAPIFLALLAECLRTPCWRSSSAPTLPA